MDDSVEPTGNLPQISAQMIEIRESYQRRLGSLGLNPDRKWGEMSMPFVGTDLF